MQIGIKRIFHVYFAVTAILPIILIGLISLFIIRDQLIKGVDDGNVTLAHSVANQITTYLKEPEATFTFLARHLTGQPHSKEILSTLLDNLTDSYSYFESVYLLDHKGIVREAGFEKSAQLKKIDYLGIDFSSLEIFQRAMSEKHSQWQSTLSVTTGEPSISFCAPLATGTILATMNLSNLGRIIKTAISGRSYEAFIVDRKGRIISHPDPKVVMLQENISNLKIIRDSLAGKSSSGSFDFRNVSYRGSAVKIEGFDWILVVAQNLDVAMAPVKSLEKIYLAGMLATLLLTLIASSIASLLLGKPFAQLSENAHHVINENYERVKPISSHLHEITLLSETLKKMVDAVKTREGLLNEQTEELISSEESLRDLNQTLEQRVRERTERLAEAMDELNTLNVDLTQRSMSLENANHQLESFAYSVSHDLRAPLRHIGSFTTIIVDEYSSALDEKGKDYLQRVVNGCKKMDELIDALLEFSRVSRQTLRFSPVDMSGLVSEVLDEFQNEINQHEVETVVGALPVCSADRALMKQVLANIIGNALKYSRKQEKPKVSIGASITNGEIMFFVKDNGAGFNMQYVNKLFGVFSRLHRQEDFEGTGVGLAIAQNIIQRHGGRIWAEAVPGHGATFFFTIPL
jgi:signal transduction histidine kinase